jgi:hypothetical protein
VDRRFNGRETDGHLTCCVLCIVLSHLSHAHATVGSAAFLRPLVSNTGMSSTRQEIYIPGLTHTVWRRLPSRS